VLFQPLFKTGIDTSFGTVKELVGTGPVVSVFYGDREDPYFRFDLDLMIGLTPAASAALWELQEWVNATKVELTIVPGSLCVIDNRRTVHARSAFRAHYDGRDRWLERVSVVEGLTPSFADRAKGSRIIDTDFSGYLAD
jgi:alpha-ketoglutarate-dependent taurine dioxygenase